MGRSQSFILRTGEVEKENNSYLVLNRLRVIKLLSTIKKQHPDWEKVKKIMSERNISTHTAQRKEKKVCGSRQLHTGNQSTCWKHWPALPIILQTSGCLMHSPQAKQQGISYASNASTHRAPLSSSRYLSAPPCIPTTSTFVLHTHQSSDKRERDGVG